MGPRENQMSYCKTYQMTGIGKTYPISTIFIFPNEVKSVANFSLF